MLDKSLDAIAAAIAWLGSAPLREIGMREREWMQREFSRDTIGARLAVYSDMLARNAGAAAR